MGLGERQSLLANLAADAALKTLDDELQPRLSRADRHKAETTRHSAATNNIPTMAAGTAKTVSRMPAPEDSFATTERHIQYFHYTETKTVVQFATGGHLGPPVSWFW